MRVLLTGHTGLLGNELKREFSKRSHEVVLFADRLENDFDKNYTERYDWVVHAAALTSVDRCERERELCWRVNALGTKKMRDIAKKDGARFLYISTASVFSGLEGDYRERDRPYPQNFYNLSKFSGEIFALEYDKSVVARLVVLGVHRSGSRGKNFVEWLVDSFAANKSVNLFNDVTINPLSHRTLSEMLTDVIESSMREPIIHLTSSDRLSKAAIGRLVLEHFPHYQGVVTDVSSDIPGTPLHPKQMWLNSEATVRIFGFELPTIKQEIEKILHSAK